MVKLEGAGKVGERRLAVVGIRDPYVIENIDAAIAWARARLAERFGAPAEAGWSVHYHLFGRNGVMGELEPKPAFPSARARHRGRDGVPRWRRRRRRSARSPRATCSMPGCPR
ncbi:MAG: hypothetical protein RML45_01675 [Acetobacteraceae bacterium]|nr:hypothetical protein [Acetobacteraceae bacterium]